MKTCEKDAENNHFWRQKRPPVSSLSISMGGFLTLSSLKTETASAKMTRKASHTSGIALDGAQRLVRVIIIAALKASPFLLKIATGLAKEDTYGAYNWGRKKALCCSPNPTALETLTCDADLCSDFDEGCDEEDGFVGEGDGYYTLLSKRSYELSNGKRMWSYGPPHVIESRVATVPGKARSLKIAIDAITGSSLFKDGMKRLFRPYPPGLKVFKGEGSSTLGLAGGFSMLQDGSHAEHMMEVNTTTLSHPSGFEALADQTIELNMILKFLVTTLSGDFPDGNLMKAAKIDLANFLARWNKVYDVSLPLVGQLVTDVKGWAAPMTPNDRVFEILGSYAYRTGMSILEAEMNIIKMTLWMD
ncbi:bacteriodes thetaiotaomicron symbiotic chitinase variant 3 [Penicillium concentricum]|uniref:Bacteriodes thetaiotaomicron symbiotic chitinase variant 3 n=1 Tax=Penicillium concentricum TaxID=293559 RepID=A0A9W9RHS6_9EURO|nr:bacteriodes thetaiotaomicron symbiotic chitinase variant 3 [Penicillium concentricum]KAJ5360513.1 bacteriodes thetaiotaomicron symbiotic chitinase variant 3 [Penicillium concentricum]